MQPPLNRSIALVIAILSVQSPVAAQTGARLDLRIVPQVGTIPTAIDDLPGTVHAPVIGPGGNRLRRFEIQYRLVDLFPDDGVRPAGLERLSFNLSVVVSGPPLSSLTLEKARLSNYEASRALAEPPPMRDTSGVQTNPFGNWAGLHRPFRGAIGFDHVNDPDNGLLTTSPAGNPQLTGMMALSLSLNGQHSVPGRVNGDVLGDWFGLYSLEITPGSTNGVSDVRVLVGNDGSASPTFSWFPDDDSPARSELQLATADASVAVFVPSPTCFGIGLSTLLTLRRRNRTQCS